MDGQTDGQTDRPTDMCKAIYPYFFQKGGITRKVFLKTMLDSSFLLFSRSDVKVDVRGTRMWCMTFCNYCVPVAVPEHF